MTKIGIVGISGYSGYVALEILLKHPLVRVTYVSANNTKGAVGDIWPQLRGKTTLTCDTYNAKAAVEKADLFFLAVPHTVSMEIVPDLLKANKKVIDLSGDYRLASASDYTKWYGTNHKDSENLNKAVYGLPEVFRAKIKPARLVSNPGCYPTAAILALTPLVSTKAETIDSIFIDAKSGVSGAGRKVATPFLFAEINENFKAYKVLAHQHCPEIELYLSRVAGEIKKIHFVPHLLPLTRGIFETIYIPLKKKMSLDNLMSLYKKFYNNEPFIRVLPEGFLPELKHVVGTNFCDIGLSLNEDQNVIVITTAIDNLLKGAAGQAVQNMNIVCGFKEQEALF